MRRRQLLTATAGALLASHLPAAAQTRKPMSDVIVVLPGLTGSVLRKDGKELWAPSARALTAALLSLGRNLQALRLADDPPDVDDLGDGVVADRLCPDLHLIPGLWKIDGYTKMIEQIERAYQVERGRNFFEFPYDWRRDNRVAARRLQRQSHMWLKAWRDSSGNKDARLILVAHSMGGLVSRYFLECLEGWRSTRKLITFGTPYRGSPNALKSLSNGYGKIVGAIELETLTELLRSFTAVYQLLPVYPCYDAGDGRLVRVGETEGIPNVDPVRAARALAFHHEIDEANRRNRSDANYVGSGCTIHPIVGRFQPTLQAAKRVGSAVEFSTRYPGDENVDGDGTVPRQSAVPKELSAQQLEFGFAEAHGSLQNSAVALVQLDTILAQPKWDLYKFVGAFEISLLSKDIFTSREPVVIRARYAPADLNLPLIASIENVSTGKAQTIKLQRGKDGTHTGTHSRLPEGAYRLKVARGSDSVTDLIYVTS